MMCFNIRSGLRLALLGLLSCQPMSMSLLAQREDGPRTAPLSYRFTRPPGETKTPLELNANKPYVLVLVNKNGPYWFILDTGSWSNAVDSETAKNLGITVSNPFEAQGAGEKTVTGAVGSNISLEIAGVELAQKEIDVEPLNAALSAAEGRTVDGLLGYDFFSRLVVQIDYAQREVHVLEPTSFHYSGPGDTIPIEIIRGNIFISTHIAMPNGERVRGSFMIDTGWRSALSLTAPFAAAHNPTKVSNTVDAVTGMGIGGPTLDTVARIPSLELGRYTIKNLVANFSHAKAGVLSQTDFTGIIGAEILRRFKVIFDYPHRRMILEPNAAFSTPYEFDMSGLFITAGGGQHKVFTVYGVVKNSPAMQADIRAGDVIEAIDDHPASNFTLEQIRQLFKQPAEQEHSLTIKRDKKILAVKFRLHRIV